MNKSTLGKGLKELLQENELSNDSQAESVVEIPLEQIRPNPYQPRYLFDEEKMQELAASIKQNGVFQPIIVKKMNKFYAIIAGERRYRACKMLGLKTIPAIVRMYEKGKMAQIALIENLQRADLTPIEEAKGYMQIMRELDLTQKQVGERVGKSRSHVTNMLGLLSLPEDVLSLVDGGKISMGHARVLSKLEDINKVRELARLIIEKDLSVREIEELAKEEKKTKEIKKTEPRKYLDIEKRLYQKYRIKIAVSDNKIVIKDADHKKIEEIIEKLMR